MLRVTIDPGYYMYDEVLHTHRTYGILNLLYVKNSA